MRLLIRIESTGPIRDGEGEKKFPMALLMVSWVLCRANGANKELAKARAQKGKSTICAPGRFFGSITALGTHKKNYEAACKRPMKQPSQETSQVTPLKERLEDLSVDFLVLDLPV